MVRDAMRTDGSRDFTWRVAPIVTGVCALIALFGGIVVATAEGATGFVVACFALAIVFVLLTIGNLVIRRRFRA